MKAKKTTRTLSAQNEMSSTDDSAKANKQANTPVVDKGHQFPHKSSKQQIKQVVKLFIDGKADNDLIINAWYRIWYNHLMKDAHKLLQKMRNNPLDWRIENLETIARYYGINIRKSGGSHVIFDHPA